MVVAGVSSAILCSSATANTKTTFAGNFEVGSPGWQQFSGLQYEEDRPVSDSFEIVRRPVRQGAQAAKFTVRHGYSRYGYGEDTELEWHSFEKPGDDYWYAWSTLFPTDWQPPFSWGIFAQWHARLGTAPIISFNARADTAVLDVRSGLTDEGRNEFKVNREVKILSTLSKGRWNDFVMHVVWSARPTGSVEVFHRVQGTKQLRRVASIRRVPTFQWRSDSVGIGAYLLFGLYRGSSCREPTSLGCTGSRGEQPTNVIYHDGFVRARTFAGAVAKAYPGDATKLPAAVVVRPRAPQGPGKTAASVSSETKVAVVGAIAIAAAIAGVALLFRRPGRHRPSSSRTRFRARNGV